MTADETTQEIRPDPGPPATARPMRTRPDTGPDFRPMVRAAAMATALAAVTKIGAALIMANRRDATVEIRFYRSAVPYLAFLMPRSPYLTIAATSTLVMAVAVTLAYVVSLLRQRRRQYVAGWLAGPMALFNVLTVDAARHLVDPPYLLWSITRWAVLCLVAGVLLTTVWLGLMKPWRAPEVDPDGPQAKDVARRDSDEASHPQDFAHG
jgi:hypothetical protein